MVSILSKPGFQRRAMPLSVKAWHQMIASGLAPERAELIRGVIVEKMSKSILHTKLTDALIEYLRAVIKGPCWIRQEAPLTLTDSEPEPDISIVPGRRADYAEHPATALLVVEVAITTLHEDREMADVYAEAGVAEFWLLNGAEKCIEVYRDPVDGHYQTQLRVAEGGVLECGSLPGVSVNVTDLFTGIAAA
ncbi:MAG: Uma2 family endonuclease [Verrucomicrobiaceae bacterium]|jgi:Uma2 family endonuclease|nr:Uma2 family endonuclease [Verrucomicrobiaceae bacterium]